ncbi:aromatic amino acid lyase [Bacillus sp. REN16]|uniref:aromatic amino acid lyase n=1 Tax=Bacillus sp. REN16 TaxID=2887296 RepID=UPI001E565B40|nr:aromatic amino acid lyase [Bacillus sp. REN16]MCC3359158.1 aromatic amino acid lyase [Bacillus sp. REN16]
MELSNSTIFIDTGKRNTLHDIICVARKNAKVSVSAEVMKNLREAHDKVKSFIKSETSIYGLTTGLGSQKEIRLSEENLRNYNEAIIIEHASAVGPEVSKDVIRATIFNRLYALAQGGSGISPETFLALLNLLNADITPVVNKWGSVGEADLGQLGQISLVLLGHGTAYIKGEKVSGSKALEMAGLKPIILQPRDALALIGTNSFSAAIAGLAIWDAQSYMDWSLKTTSLSWIAFKANPSQLRSDVLTIRGNEVSEIGSRIQELISGIEYKPKSIQDPLSFRCVPHVQGALLNYMNRFEICVLDEVSNPLDNPFFKKETSELISIGNFDPTQFTIECDALRNALFRTILLQEKRVGKLLTTYFSGYPTGLAFQEGYAGFDVLHHTVLSLVGKVARLAQVTSPQFGMAAEGVEDYGAMATEAAQALEKMVQIWRLIIAIELTVATRALTFSSVTLKGPLKSLMEELTSLTVSLISPSEKVRAVENMIINKTTV